MSQSWPISTEARTIVDIAKTDGYRFMKVYNELSPECFEDIKEGHEVYVVVDAIGSTSVTAHDMALRRVGQVGGKMISVTQLFCQLQRDRAIKDTAPGFMTLIFDMHGNAGVAMED